MAQPILILGGDGLLGGALTAYFEKLQAPVVAWDKAQIDVTSNAQLITKITPLNPQAIINATAYNSVDQAEENPAAFALAQAINATAVGNMASLSNALSCPLVHFSTDYVFAGSDKNGYAEDAQLSPVNKYGQTKAAGEQLIQSAAKEYYIIRLSRMFGHPGKSVGAKKSFVDLMLDAAIAQPHKEIRLVDEEVSCPTYSVDLAQFVGMLLREKKPFGIYHGANSGTATWYSLAEELFRLKQISVKLVPIKTADYPRPAKRPLFSELRNTKTAPQRSWKAALRDYLQM